MNWDFSFTNKARKEFSKIGSAQQQAILKFLTQRIKSGEDPRRFGKPLKGDLGQYWRYRVQDYRILCEIKDGALLVLVIKVGHRKDIYE